MANNEINFTGCDRPDGTSRGIYLGNSMGATVSNNTIEGLTHDNSFGIQFSRGSSVKEANGNMISVPNGVGFYLNDATVQTMDGNTVNYGTNGFLLKNNSVCTDAISSNTLTGTRDTLCFGINVAGSAVNTVHGNTIGGKNNHGIFIHENEGIEASANKVSENHISNPTHDGIYVADTAANTDIASNTVTAPGNNGVKINRATVNAIRHNTVTDYGDNGVLVIASAKVTDTIYDNVLRGATETGSGVNIAGGQAKTISTNTIDGANRHGIFVHASEDAQGKADAIYNNTIRDVLYDGICVADGAADTDVTTNLIVSPGENGIKIRGAVVPRVIHNTVIDYKGCGILLNACAQVSDTISSNKLTGGSDSGYGINISGSTAKAISANVIDGVNCDGIFVHLNNEQQAKVASILSNKIEDVAHDGIHMVNTDADSDIASNTITAPGGQRPRQERQVQQAPHREGQRGAVRLEDGSHREEWQVVQAAQLSVPVSRYDDGQVQDQQREGCHGIGCRRREGREKRHGNHNRDKRQGNSYNQGDRFVRCYKADRM